MRRLVPAFLALALLVGCAGQQQPPAIAVTPQSVTFEPTTETYTPVDSSSVAVYDGLSESYVPGLTRIAAASLPPQHREEDALRLLIMVRNEGARRGANAIIRTWDSRGTRYRAVRLTPSQVLAAAHMVAPRMLWASAGASPSVSNNYGGAAAGAGGGGGAASGGSSTPGTDVHVRGHTRKDGTYVPPHTRSRPRSRRP